MGGPRLPLHTEQPLLSHIDCFAEDLCVLPQEGRAGQRGGGLQPALLRRAFPLRLFPQGPASLPCPALGTQASSVPVVGEPVDEGSVDLW